MKTFRNEIAAPRVFVRVMDLVTGEHIAACETSLLNLSISRTLNDASTASVTFSNGNNQFYTKEKRKSVWDLLAASKNSTTNNGSKKTTFMYPRQYQALNPGATATTPEQDFFKTLFYGDPVFREASTDRVHLYNEFIDKVRGGKPITAADIHNFYECDLTIALKARVEIDLMDYRGFIFPAFTGFIKSISESKGSDRATTISISCGDFIELWKSAILVTRRPFEVIAQQQEEYAQEGLKSGKDQYESVLMNETPDGVFKILVDTVNATQTARGFLDSMNVSMAVVRDPVSGFLYTPEQSVQVPSSNSSVKPKFIYNDKIWSDVKPYIGEPVDFETPWTIDNYDYTKFRGVRGAFYDLNFSRKFRRFAPLAMKMAVRHSIDRYFSNSSHPFDQMSALLQTTLGELYCNASGDVVFKLPRFNHVPATDSCWSPEDKNKKFYEIVDYGMGLFQAPECMHGSEYIFTPYGRLSLNTSTSILGKFTRVKVPCGVHYDRSFSESPVGLYASQTTVVAPEELQSVFGSQEYKITVGLTSMTETTAKWFSSSLLSLLNWKDNTASVELGRFVPLEVGHNFYIPDNNWLYRINSISYNYDVTSQTLSQTVQGDYGHPWNVVLPIPWMLLYDGKVGTPETAKALKTYSGGDLDWEKSLTTFSAEILKAINKFGSAKQYGVTGMTPDRINESLAQSDQEKMFNQTQISDVTSTDTQLDKSITGGN